MIRTPIFLVAGTDRRPPLQMKYSIFEIPASHFYSSGLYSGWKLKQKEHPIQLFDLTPAGIFHVNSAHFCASLLLGITVVMFRNSQKSPLQLFNPGKSSLCSSCHFRVRQYYSATSIFWKSDGSKYFSFFQNIKLASCCIGSYYRIILSC